MQSLVRDGVSLAYADSDPDGVSRPCMLLIHGWCGDHTLMIAQAKSFSISHRVISVDLRGYGESDAPEQEYSMAAFANDVAWLCEQLKLVKPVVVGHSMGGNVALELAAHHAHIPLAVVLVDTLLFPSPELKAGLSQMVAGVSGDDYVAVANGILKSLCLPSDSFGQRVQPTDSLHAPHHVILSSLRHHTTEYSGAEAAAACKLPLAYIAAASNPLANLAELRRVAPQLQTGSVLGAGHFCAQEDPAQVNAMIERFVHLLSTPKETNGDHQ